MDEYDSAEEELSIRPLDYRPDDADCRSDYVDSDGDSCADNDDYAGMDEAMGTADYDYMRSEFKFQFSSTELGNPILSYPAVLSQQ